MTKFGIRGTLPSTDPMLAPHLLGENWEWSKWYKTEGDRDAAFDQIKKEFSYYRAGDVISQVLTKMEE